MPVFRRRRGFRPMIRKRRFSRYPRYTRKRFRRTLKAEVKKVVGNASDGSIDQGGVVTLLTPVAQGLDDGQRVGVKISAKYLYVRCSLTNSDAAQTSGANTKIRQMIVQDNQMVQNTAPTVAQILDDATAGDRMIQSPLNRDHAGRFKVLMDRVYTLNSTTASVTAADTTSAPIVTSPFIQKRFWKKYFKLGGRPIRYFGADTTMVQNGNIYLITMTDQDENGAFNVSWSFGYTDA